MTADRTDFFIDRPTRPPFDPELIPVLDAFGSTLPRMSADTIDSFRQNIAQGQPGLGRPDLTAGGQVRLEERQIPGVDGEDIAVLILRPAHDDSRPLPAIFHVHGGGMVVGDRRHCADMFLPYVVDGNAVLVSVEYRLPPEHPDPAPIQDCYAGLVWLAQHVKELGVDPGRLIVAGVSAGGGLAAGLAIMARDKGFPKLSHQVLICPMLDDRFETVSSRMLDGEGVWDRNENLFGWTSLLGQRRGGADVSPYAAPARVADPAGLPPTYIDVGGAEGFRDEAVVYAQRLSEAGVSVDLHVFAGGFHGYDAMVPDAAISRAAVASRHEFFRRAFTRDV